MAGLEKIARFSGERVLLLGKRAFLMSISAELRRNKLKLV